MHKQETKLSIAQNYGNLTADNLFVYNERQSFFYYIIIKNLTTICVKTEQNSISEYRHKLSIYGTKNIHIKIIAMKIK